jgi:hypothetical protein
MVFPCLVGGITTKVMIFLFQLLITIFAPMIAITGCGRAGTVYTSKLFQSCGVIIGHEKLEKDGIISWWITGDKQPSKGESWDEVSLFYPIVFHQIRNPIQAISSITTIKQNSWDFIGKHILLSDDVLKNAMLYYLHWNIAAQEKACFTYPIEHIGDNWSTILKLAGISQRPMPIIAAQNERAHRDYSWKDLKNCDAALCEQIREYAFQFYPSKLLF